MSPPGGPDTTAALSPWADAACAAALLAVDPVGLGGAVLRSPAGAVRDHWLGLLRGLLPEGAPLRRVPLHIHDERLLGGLDLAATLQAGRPVAQRGLFLQLGAFASADNAESLRSHLSRELEWLSEGIQINPGGGIHRVHLGPYASRSDAERVAEKIRQALGYKPALVMR